MIVAYRLEEPAALRRMGVSPMNNRVKGTILAVGGAACWGISGCTGQYLFTYEGMTAEWLTPIRLFFAGVVLFLYYVIRSPRQLFAPWRTPRDAVDLLIYGICGVSCCQYLYFLTIDLSTAGIGTIMQSIAPAMILVVVCVMERRIPRLFEGVSVLLALAGVFLLTTHGSLTHLALSPAALAAGLLSAVCVVVYTMWPKRLQSSHPTPILQCWAFLMGGTIFFVLFRPWEVAYVPTITGCIGIAIVVLIGNVVAYCAYMQGVKLIGPQKSSLYSFAEPATAAVISTLVLGSPFTLWDALGFGCIFVMLVVLTTFQQRGKKPLRKLEKARAHS